MPFKSKAQARKLFSLEAQGKLKPGTAEEFAHATRSFKRLPEHLADGGEVPSAWDRIVAHFDPGTAPGGTYPNDAFLDRYTPRDTVQGPNGQPMADWNPILHGMAAVRALRTGTDDSAGTTAKGLSIETLRAALGLPERKESAAAFSQDDLDYVKEHPQVALNWAVMLAGSGLKGAPGAGAAEAPTPRAPATPGRAIPAAELPGGAPMPFSRPLTEVEKLPVVADAQATLRARNAAAADQPVPAKPLTPSQRAYAAYEAMGDQPVPMTPRPRSPRFEAIKALLDEQAQATAARRSGPVVPEVPREKVENFDAIQQRLSDQLARQRSGEPTVLPTDPYSTWFKPEETGGAAFRNSEYQYLPAEPQSPLARLAKDIMMEKPIGRSSVKPEAQKALPGRPDTATEPPPGFRPPSAETARELGDLDPGIQAQVIKNRNLVERGQQALQIIKDPKMAGTKDAVDALKFLDSAEYHRAVLAVGKTRVQTKAKGGIVRSTAFSKLMNQK